MARLVHNALERRTGDIHLLGGIFLVAPLQIDQAQRFQLLV
jgi:hypothetical protein